MLLGWAPPQDSLDEPPGAVLGFCECAPYYFGLQAFLSKVCDYF